ncbi:MAG: hypothetical protein AB7U82_12835 [Blastocatellales bacterium]
MNDDPFKHFKTRDDYTHWDNYIEQVRLCANLTAEEIIKAESALLTLKDHLGDDAWLSEALKNRHPIIVGYLMNNAPWTRKVLIRVADAIKTFSQKKDSNYSSVSDRLRQSEKFTEAHSVLETGYKFLQHGFEVTFDPSITINRKDGSHNEKVPDLKITNTDTEEEIFVEVSALGFSNKLRQTSNAERVIFFQLLDAMGFAADVIMRARTFKAPDEAVLKTILQEIKHLASKARASGAFEAWTSEGVIELAAAPADQAEAVHQWAAEREIGQGEIIRGAPIDLNDPKRLILDKIGKEVRQLPKDRPGMIVVDTTRNLLFYTYPMAMIGAPLSRQLQRYSQLACAAVTYCHFVDSEEAPVEHVSTSDYSIRERVIGYPLRETTLLAHNNLCQQPLTEATFDRVCQSFAGPSKL